MTTILLAALLAAAAPALAEHEGAERGGRGGGAGVRAGGGAVHPHSGGGAPAHPGGGAAHPYGGRPSTVIRMHRVAVPRAAPAPQPSERVRGGPHTFSAPRRDDHGAAITQHPAARPPAGHAAVTRNRAVVRGVGVQRRSEVVPNRFYWHHDGGVRYAHYYDGRAHWWGFYHGDRFYWCRFHANRWWWYDPVYTRWVFWWDGFWWWPGANGAMYVYVDNAYYPYENGGVTVQSPEEQAPPEEVPSPSAGSKSVSPDDKRMVQITGGDSEAFLYDNTTNPPSYLKYLGKNVEKVRFSGAQVLVEFKDNTFALFGADGNPLDASSAAGAAGGEPPSPPETPESTPPMPTSAPGQ